MVCDAIEGFEILVPWVHPGSVDYLYVLLCHSSFMVGIESNFYTWLDFGGQCSLPFFMAIEVVKILENKYLANRVEEWRFWKWWTPHFLLHPNFLWFMTPWKDLRFSCLPCWHWKFSLLPEDIFVDVLVLIFFDASNVSNSHSSLAFRIQRSNPFHFHNRSSSQSRKQYLVHKVVCKCRFWNLVNSRFLLHHNLLWFVMPWKDLRFWLRIISWFLCIIVLFYAWNYEQFALLIGCWNSVFQIFLFGNWRS